MLYACDACGDTFQSTKGLNTHQRFNCVALAEQEDSLPANALQLYQQRREKKRRRLEAKMNEQPPQKLDPGPVEGVPQVEGVLLNPDDLDDTPMPDASGKSLRLDENKAEVPEQEPILGRGARTKRLTWKMLERMPAAPAPPPKRNTPEQMELEDPAIVPGPEQAPAPVVLEWFRTIPNPFSILREYLGTPSHNPDTDFTLEKVADGLLAPPQNVDNNNEGQAPPTSQPVMPCEHMFPNSTVFQLMQWMWTGSATKSITEMARLIEILQSPEFEKAHLEGFNIHKETARLDASLDFQAGRNADEGWQESEVTIEVPDGQKHSDASSNPPKSFTFPGLYHRSITAVIRKAFADETAREFHYTPFKSIWRPSPPAQPADNVPGDSLPVPEQRIYDEIYSSDAMLEEHEKLQRSPPEPGCNLERVVASLMFWSDSTHLASFGNASLWPVYLFFGNQSKWARCKPRLASCHHVAYIPKLPSEFHDFFAELTGEAPTADILSHCRREVIHAVWTILLDKDFLHAYKHGIVICCPDGILRRFYPRIFTYSADYPEKVLLATIRNLGTHPCPRCLVSKEQIPQVGTKYDDRRRVTQERTPLSGVWDKIKMARDWIYKQAYGVKSAAVERLLSDQSLVPTVNAFSQLKDFDFNPFKMLVVDFMHEFELGVWKAFFKHLLRMVYSCGGSGIQVLNERFRSVPPFGRSTIRRFSENASAMKKLAARNYEDLLQASPFCSIPVFEGLFDEPHNSVVLSLLFTFAEWHTLAKLRLHTDQTLDWLEAATTELGRDIRRFASNTCSHFETYELPAEEAARGRREARKRVSQTGSETTPETQGSTRVKTRKKVPFNLIMYKLHALGDYVRTIRWFGTTDSYSTQSGEREHRRVKKFYARTNKNTAVRQMTRLERREQALRRAHRKKSQQAHQAGIPPAALTTKRTRKKRILDSLETETLPTTPPDIHHHISASRNNYVNILSFLADHQGDPAVENFREKLEEHVLARIRHPTWSGDGNEYLAEDRQQVVFLNDRMYFHKLMRVNFTTYDVRRGQDSLSARKRSDVMTLARDETNPHPFDYARIIGIFHVDVAHPSFNDNYNGHHLEILWVRRFSVDSSYTAGFKKKRLHRLQFLDSSDPDSFGFLHPDEIIRGAHLIPAFHHGGTSDYLSGRSIARNEDEIDDYRYFYVNMFVDRDMYMRYTGGGVGHYPIKIEDVPQEASMVQESELLDRGASDIQEDSDEHVFCAGGSGDEGEGESSGEESEGSVGEGISEAEEDMEADAEGEFVADDDEDYE